VGGDEFVIVAEGLADEQSAFKLAQRIIEAAREPFRVGDDDLVCTVSIGIACTTNSEGSAEDLVGEANLALYRAKQRGRNRAEAFDEDLRVRAVGRLATESMLRRALDRQQLVVEYQPIIDLRTGRRVGAEALMRLRDPEGRLLLPRSFLEVAEETGLLTGMDEQVLADAVRVAGAWHTSLGGSDPAEVSINVTARQLAEPAMPKQSSTSSMFMGCPTAIYRSNSLSGAFWRPLTPR
jgi:predicted signal transduction protein with EAL and GGDEF domain